MFSLINILTTPCNIQDARVVPKVSGLIYKETQYNKSDQFIFLRNLCKLQCTYYTVPAASVFQSCRRVHLAILVPEGSPSQTQWCHCHLKIVCHASVLSSVGTSRSQRVLGLANVVDGVMIRSHIQSQQTLHRQRCGQCIISFAAELTSHLSSMLAFQYFTYSSSKLYLYLYVCQLIVF